MVHRATAETATLPLNRHDSPAPQVSHEEVACQDLVACSHHQQPAGGTRPPASAGASSLWVDMSSAVPPQQEWHCSNSSAICSDFDLYECASESPESRVRAWLACNDGVESNPVLESECREQVALAEQKIAENDIRHKHQPILLTTGCCNSVQSKRSRVGGRQLDERSSCAIEQSHSRQHSSVPVSIDGSLIDGRAYFIAAGEPLRFDLFDLNGMGVPVGESQSDSGATGPEQQHGAPSRPLQSAGDVPLEPAVGSTADVPAGVSEILQVLRDAQAVTAVKSAADNACKRSRVSFRGFGAGALPEVSKQGAPSNARSLPVKLPPQNLVLCSCCALVGLCWAPPLTQRHWCRPSNI